MKADVYPRQLSLLIDGRWRGAEGHDTRPVTNPASDEVLAELPLATPADLDEALNAAQHGFQTWRAASPWERDAILRRAAQFVAERRSSLAAVLSLENGKTLAEAQGELDRVVETIAWCAEEGKRAYGRLMPPRAPGLTQMTVKRPIGPVAAFAPWNFPVVLVARKLAAALAAGCSVVVKPAEETPAACIGLVQAFQDAGVPKGVINLVFGVPADVSRHLIASPVIRKVSFTGSVPVGRQLAKLAAERLIPATMELGGHSPVIVFDDVDIDRVAATCATFKFRNAGQVCIAPNRFYVQVGVYEAFVARFAEFARALKVGDGWDAGVQMGPLNNARRLAAAESFVADARARGARVHTGGERIGRRGLFFAPTVITDLDPGSSLLREEPFCPVAPIQPFGTVEEAIAHANGTEYGLAAYAFTGSLARAHAVCEGFEAGWIGINSFTPALADAPIGGLKHSGLGYEGGPEGLDAYMHTRFVSQSVA